MFKENQIVRTEMRILASLDWDIYTSNAGDFIHSVLERRQSPSDRQEAKLRTFVDFFEDLVNQELEFMQYPSHILGASIIAAAR